MGEHSPTPWRVEAETYVDSRHSGDAEGEFLAGWNIYAADGTEIVGCEGILGDGEAAANRIVQAVNCHADMVEALGDVETYLDSYIDELAAADIHAAYSKSMLAVVRSALAKASPTPRKVPDPTGSER